MTDGQGFTSAEAWTKQSTARSTQQSDRMFGTVIVGSTVKEMKKAS